jgi:hypothetical protein
MPRIGSSTSSPSASSTRGAPARHAGSRDDVGHADASWSDVTDSRSVSLTRSRRGLHWIAGPR